MLPSAQRIPPIGDLFTQQSTSPVPKQGTLAAVGAHEAWIACLAACEEIDKNTPQSEAINSEEATRYISISQARNGRKDWLNSPVRANWVKNKQEANGFLRSAPVGGARAA